jgi:hypothetical protein
VEILGAGWKLGEATKKLEVSVTKPCIALIDKGLRHGSLMSRAREPQGHSVYRRLLSSELVICRLRQRSTYYESGYCTQHDSTSILNSRQMLTAAQFCSTVEPKDAVILSATKWRETPLYKGEG